MATEGARERMIPLEEASALSDLFQCAQTRNREKGAALVNLHSGLRRCLSIHFFSFLILCLLRDHQ